MKDEDGYGREEVRIGQEEGLFGMTDIRQTLYILCRRVDVFFAVDTASQDWKSIGPCLFYKTDRSD
jgi:hypothetical protein